MGFGFHYLLVLEDGEPADPARGVHKLDLPCKDADSAASADVAAYGMDHAEKLRG